MSSGVRTGRGRGFFLRTFIQIKREVVFVFFWGFQTHWHHCKEGADISTGVLNSTLSAVCWNTVPGFLHIESLLSVWGGTQCVLLCNKYQLVQRFTELPKEPRRSLTNLLFQPIKKFTTGLRSHSESAEFQIHIFVLFIKKWPQKVRQPGYF